MNFFNRLINRRRKKNNIEHSWIFSTIKELKNYERNVKKSKSKQKQQEKHLTMLKFIYFGLL